MSFGLQWSKIKCLYLICDFYSSDQRFARGLVCSPHPASFRFHLTVDTLAFGYILPTTGRIQDLHLLETCAARRTTRNGQKIKKNRWFSARFEHLFPIECKLLLEVRDMSISKPSIHAHWSAVIRCLCRWCLSEIQLGWWNPKRFYPCCHWRQ